MTTLVKQQLGRAVQIDGEREKWIAKGKPDYQVSSGNVFADLGVSNSEEALAKAELAQKITAVMQPSRDWECFDSDSGKDSAREIREVLYSGFQ